MQIIIWLHRLVIAFLLVPVVIIKLLPQLLGQDLMLLLPYHAHLCFNFSTPISPLPALLAALHFLPHHPSCPILHPSSYHLNSWRWHLPSAVILDKLLSSLFLKTTENLIDLTVRKFLSSSSDISVKLSPMVLIFPLVARENKCTHTFPWHLLSEDY